MIICYARQGFSKRRRRRDVCRRRKNLLYLIKVDRISERRALPCNTGVFEDGVDKRGVVPAKQKATSASENGIQFIMQHEGFKEMPYNDSVGNATIGYEHFFI